MNRTAIIVIGFILLISCSKENHFSRNNVLDKINNWYYEDIDLYFSNNSKNQLIKCSWDVGEYKGISYTYNNDGTLNSIDYRHPGPASEESTKHEIYYNDDSKIYKIIKYDYGSFADNQLDFYDTIVKLIFYDDYLVSSIANYKNDTLLYSDKLNYNSEDLLLSVYRT